MSDATTEYDKLFIGGKWTEPSTSEVIEVHCPATGEYVGKVPLAAAADVDAAVAAARAAFDNGPWPSTPPKERAAVIAGALKLLVERKPLFVVECESLRGFTQRDAADLAKRQARMLRPYRKQVREARDFLLRTGPEALLANRAAGVEAEHGRREPEQAAAPSLRIRPELEDAIEAAGPAPSEAAARQVRTGTDDDAVSLDDLIDDDFALSAPAGVQDDGEEAITFDDLCGE